MSWPQGTALLASSCRMRVVYRTLAEEGSWSAVRCGATRRRLAAPALRRQG